MIVLPGRIFLTVGFSFQHFVSCHCLPACKVSAESQHITLRRSPRVYVCFLWLLFRFSLILPSSLFVLYGNHLFGALCASWSWISASFPSLGRFLELLFLQINFLSFWDPYNVSVTKLADVLGIL